MAEKKTVLFIPMDGNHWDSMDSIWRTYQEQETYEVIVLQPPFFRLRDEEEFLVECEIEGYPIGVEVVSFDTLDLEELQPDMIYINDPGDGYRDGIRIHPYYSAENLRQWTKQLIFIPYYYLQEPLLGDMNAVAKMQKDVLVPSVLYAHQTLVQSESMRQVYVILLTALQGLETKKSWEEKILGTGDSKLQWLSRSKEEIGNISEECLTFLRKKDGTYKKVILHYVPILSFLGGRQKLMHKVRQNLEQLEKYPEEVVYLLKVEPDTEQVILPLHQGLYEEIRSLKECFAASANAIYDDTPFTARAMAMCDGFYGEKGSLASLLETVPKPVVYEDLDTMETAEEILKMLFGEG